MTNIWHERPLCPLCTPNDVTGLQRGQSKLVTENRELSVNVADVQVINSGPKQCLFGRLHAYASAHVLQKEARQNRRNVSLDAEATFMTTALK